MDTNEMIVAALVVAGAIVLVVIALRWRSMIAEGPGLPLWRFLRREGITRDDAADNISAKTMMRAELGCAVCGSREECRARLAAGNDAVPPANCPNAPLFEDFGVAVGKARK
jgi:uncharacterized ferredoxin-like protein